MARAQAWTLRCTHEHQKHQSAIWSTLTYETGELPWTLQKPHLSGFIKRLRKALAPNRGIRYYISGEYGEQRKRPHYHAILYGAAETDRHLIEQKWGHGHAYTVPLTPDRIAYTTGYCEKKNRYRHKSLRCDPETGELWQPEFRLMSLRPGIGAHVKQWPESWRLYAIKDGHKMAVPRFYHDAWKKQATPEQKEDLLQEKSKLTRYMNKEQLRAAEKIAEAKQHIAADKRKY